MRYVELFAGAGGLSRGLEAAGMTCVAHAEIDKHARAVLRYHWPVTPLHGDVTQVDWAQYAGKVDLVAGGSPCQDLSVAGKRAGLAGARSGLFYELICAWEKTGATYCLWENVDGARSSNGGEDFAAVLSAFVGTTVAVPSDGWRTSGVAAGRTGVAAWRVLDLQHFGPPQRRRRVFIVAARAEGCDPAEVLLEPSRVCWHPAPRDQARQSVASVAASRTGGLNSAIAPQLVFTKQQFGRYTENREVCSTIGARDHASANVDIVVTAGRARRLTPLECERLMGWPDMHTAHGIREDGTIYALPDMARYKLCGNGVGSVCAEWIGARLMAHQ